MNQTEKIIYCHILCSNNLVANKNIILPHLVLFCGVKEEKNGFARGMQKFKIQDIVGVVPQ